MKDLQASVVRLNTDTLANVLREHPDCDAAFDELCRRGDHTLAVNIRTDHHEERAIERAYLTPATRAAMEEERRLAKLGPDELLSLSHTLDRQLGSSDRSQGGFA